MNAALNAIAKASSAAASQYLQPGRYLLEVQSIKAKDGFKGTAAIVELKVIEATKTHDNEPNAVGSSPSYVENLSDAAKYGGARMKTFLCALIGEDESALADPASLAKFFGEKQAGAYLLIRAEAFPKSTAKGGTVTGIKWETVSPDDAQFTELERKRAAGKLPTFAEAMS